jgi:hypothetical protein
MSGKGDRVPEEALGAHVDLHAPTEDRRYDKLADCLAWFETSQYARVVGLPLEFDYPAPGSSRDDVLRAARRQVLLLLDHRQIGSLSRRDT